MKRFVPAILYTGLLLVWGVVSLVSHVNFDRGCKGYLKKAADANTVDLAIENLEVAIQYAEQNGLTSGFTSILYRTQDEDIGFWYKNLVASRGELLAVRSEATQLERTNVLMKLNETLLDEGQGTFVTTPLGIELYPYNAFFAYWGWLSGILALVYWLVLCWR